MERIMAAYIKFDKESNMQSFNIPGMICGGCKETIEKAILELDGSAKFTVDLETQNVDVDTQTATGAIVAALKTAGYDANPI